MEKAKAKIYDLEDGHYVPTSDVRIPTEWEDGTPILSGIGVALENRADKKLDYATEADVQTPLSLTSCTAAAAVA